MGVANGRVLESEGEAMIRFTKRNKSGEAFLITAFECPRCDERMYKFYHGDGDLVEALCTYEEAKANIPEIVCLCGSTRFYKTFDEQNFRLTLAGKIVLSIGCNTKSDEGLSLTEEDKTRLDELHKRKIDLCDSVFVLNVDGYIGSSTRSEIEYALLHGKPVAYLAP